MTDHDRRINDAGHEAVTYLCTLIVWIAGCVGLAALAAKGF